MGWRAVGEQSRLVANISGVWCQIYWKRIAASVNSNLCQCKSWHQHQFLPETESWDPEESTGGWKWNSEYPPFNETTRSGEGDPALGASGTFLSPCCPGWEKTSFFSLQHQNSSIKTLCLHYRIPKFSVVFLYYSREGNKAGELMWNAFSPHRSNH